jgi:hypothetical protein
LSGLTGVVPFREDVPEGTDPERLESDRCRAMDCVPLWLEAERDMPVETELDDGVRETGFGRGRSKSPLPGTGSRIVATDGPVPDLAGARGDGTERWAVDEEADEALDWEVRMGGGSRVLLEVESRESSLDRSEGSVSGDVRIFLWFSDGIVSGEAAMMVGGSMLCLSGVGSEGFFSGRKGGSGRPRPGGYFFEIGSEAAFGVVDRLVTSDLS